jgi:type IV pilus assembly protein PilB
MIRGEGVNVTTLEDPIEYYIDGVNQSQVNPEVGFNFVDGLRAILRQDPNVIMVGEIRDNETAELVVHAGLTGHLVFSTLHTNDAWGAIPRLVDMKAEPFLLASTLSLVMAQRLVRKLCPDCQTEEPVPTALMERLTVEISKISPEFLGDKAKNMKFYRGKGCATCSNTGYVGRTVINEMIEMTTDIKEIVAKENFDFKLVEEQLKKQKYITLRQDAIIKALNGFTSIDEVIRVTQN